MDSFANRSEIEALVALERYARELHEFLDCLPQYVRWERFDELRARCQRLIDNFPRPINDESLKAAWARTQDRLREMHQALCSSSPKAYVLARHEELARTYESWLTALRVTARSLGAASTVRLDSLKPLMRARSIFHVCMGLVAATLYHFILSRSQALAILFVALASVLLVEISRRVSKSFNDYLCTHSVLHLIGRPHEYQGVNSALYYVVSLILLALFFSPAAGIVGVLVLGFADPAAAWIGKAYGRTKLYRRKTLAGTLAFCMVGAGVGLAYLLGLHPELSLSRRVLAAGAAAVAGAVAELVSGRVDDNLTIPVTASLAAALILD